MKNKLIDNVNLLTLYQDNQNKSYQSLQADCVDTVM